MLDLLLKYGEKSLFRSSSNRKITISITLCFLAGILSRQMILGGDLKIMIANVSVSKKNSKSNVLCGNESKPVVAAQIITTKPTTYDSPNNYDGIVGRGGKWNASKFSSKVLRSKDNYNSDDHHHSRTGTNFQWEDLDVNQKVDCGADKCLFLLSSFSSNRSNDTDGEDVTARTNCKRTGYLVSKHSKVTESIFDGWKISQYLKAEFGIKHFLLQAPILKQIDESQLKKLFPSYVRSGTKTSHKAKTRSRTVQKIRIMPENSQELRLRYTEEYIASQLEELLQAQRYNDRNRCESNDDLILSQQQHLDYDDLDFFFARLSTGIATAFEMVRCEPLLALDFQVIVDSQGVVYHLDFDRVLSQFGGLLNYNQTSFDAKVRSALEKAFGVLSSVERWIQIKQNHKQQEGVNTKKANGTAAPYYQSQVLPSTATTIVGKTIKCKGDWEAEESMILASQSLSCLATERVAIVRRTTTSTMNSVKGTINPSPFNRLNNTLSQKYPIRKRRNNRLRHPLLIALLQRTIEAGFYGENATSAKAGSSSWNCNAYGDRVIHG